MLSDKDKKQSRGFALSRSSELTRGTTTTSSSMLTPVTLKTDLDSESSRRCELLSWCWNFWTEMMQGSYRCRKVLEFNTLTASAILGQMWLPLLNHKSQLSKNNVHLQPKPTVLFPFTRWQHVYYIFEAWQAALVRRWSSALCCSMRDVYALTGRGTY